MFRSEDLENKTIEKYGYRRERQFLEEIKAELREERSKRKKAEATQVQHRTAIFW